MRLESKINWGTSSFQNKKIRKNLAAVKHMLGEQLFRYYPDFLAMLAALIY